MKKLVLIIAIHLLLMGIIGTTVVFAAEETKSGAETSIKSENDNSKYAKYFGAAIAIGCATIGSGLAVGKIGSAAMGAISEKPEIGGMALVLTALAEGVSLWGFLIAFFILQTK